MLNIAISILFAKDFRRFGLECFLSLFAFVLTMAHVVLLNGVEEHKGNNLETLVLLGSPVVSVSRCKGGAEVLWSSGSVDKERQGPIYIYGLPE